MLAMVLGYVLLDNNGADGGDLTGYFVMFLIGSVALVNGFAVLGRVLWRQRLTVDSRGIILHAGSPARGYVVRAAGSAFVTGVLLIGGLVVNGTYYDLANGAQDEAATLWYLAAIVCAGLAAWWVVRAVRLHRVWRGVLAATGTPGQPPSYAMYGFAWADLAGVTVRRAGPRRARILLAVAPSMSRLFQQPGTASRYSRWARGFVICDLSATGIEQPRLIVALRQFGGDFWQQA